MKKIGILILVIFGAVSIACLTACKDIDSGNNGNQVQIIYLNAPDALAVNQADKAVTWEGVEGASGYKVKVGDAEYDAEGTFFSLERFFEQGVYIISVKSKGYIENNTVYVESEFCDGVSYTVEEAELNFFDTYRDDRQKARSEELLLLDDIINNSESSPDAIEQAMLRRTQIIKNTENELVLEALIKACGYEDCIASLNGGEGNNVNIIVKTDAEISQ